ncbi:hypothetical protein O181_003787 [Austropuccinia psidii MF-1]|uniref:Uncharacterized protein n=1 Tax=Austropuccinia psidii MF-1 TaxID=1389203 RepID=A0A9Q3BFH6_9BASI|nr:hypothetical protein [Austropuccinia psidii MF-1]
MDTWTSPYVTAFIDVTAHFMNEPHKPTSLLLGLCEIQNPLSTSFRDTILTNTFHALYMNQEIQSLCPAYTTNTQSISCIAYTIHLEARDGLKALGNVSSDELDPSISSDTMAITNLVSPSDGLNLKYDLIITHIGQLASYWHQSPQRHEKFITTVKLVYESSRPTHATMLLSHVPACWNSTYDMLNQELTLKEAYNQFNSLPSLASYQLTVLEWDKVRFMVDFLHPLYEATQIICGEYSLTIKHSFPLYIMLLKRIRKESNQYDIAPMEEAISAMQQKLSKNLQLLLQKTLVICTSILDPCFKLKFLLVHEETLAHFGTTENQCLLNFKEQANKHFKYPPDNSSKQTSMNKHSEVGSFDDMYPSSSLEDNTLETELD